MQTATDNPDAAGAERGLSIAGARQLILTKHKVAVGEDDPILMMVTLHSAFLDETDRLYRQQADALASGCSTALQEGAQSIALAVQTLRDEMLHGAVKSVLAGVAHHAESVALIKQKFRHLLVALSLLTAANWLAVITFFFVLK